MEGCYRKEDVEALAGSVFYSKHSFAQHPRVETRVGAVALCGVGGY